MSELEGLQALYTDLLALSEARLSSIDRLGAQLDAHIQEFRGLLDKKARNEQSRQKLASGKLPRKVVGIQLTVALGKLEVSGAEYQINTAFQQGSLQLSDELDLDEEDAARIFLEAQKNSETTERPVLTEAIIQFHQRRKYILDCLCLLLQLSVDVDQEEGIIIGLQETVAQIIQPEDRGSRYVKKCLSAMGAIRAWLQKLADKANGASVLGGQHQPDVLESLEYERVSLVRQHESLGIIVLLLIKQNHSAVTDFEQILNTLKSADKYDNLLGSHDPVI